MLLSELRDCAPCREDPAIHGQWQFAQMKTMKLLTPMLVLACLACSLLLVSCKSTPPPNRAKGGALYLCGCGADCKCATVTVKPGKCGCGKDLVAVHPLKVEADSVLACSCGAECKCTLDDKDAAKCGCGKPIRKVALKGSGLYYCACGGTCCVIISDMPGQCNCGKNLKRAD